MKRSKIIKAILFCALALFCHLRAYAEDKIIAIVNKDIITRKDLDDFLNFTRMQMSLELKGEQLESKIQSMKLDLLNRLIEDRLILQEAKKRGITLDDARVKAKIDEIKGRYATDAAFQKAIGRQGLTQADLENQIKEQLLMYSSVDANVRSKIVISPAEVTEFYEKNKEKIKIPEQRQILSITIGSSDNLANEIYRELNKGRDLKEILDKYSFVANKMAVMENGELRKDIEEAVFKLERGRVSRPIEINGTFYIFKLEEINTPQQKSLLEAQENIYTYLFEEKLQKDVVRWLDELRKQSYIKITQQENPLP